MGEEGRLHQHAWHVGADEDVERSALDGEIGDVRVVSAQVPDEVALEGAGQGNRLVHLPYLHQVAQDVAEVGLSRGGMEQIEAVLEGGQAAGGAILRVV